MSSHEAKDKDDKKSKRGEQGKGKNPFSPENVQETMDKIYAASLAGMPGVSKPVDQLANDYEKQFPGDVKRAAEELARNQIIKCGTAGFVTGLGGLITLPVALPADVVSVTVMQIRMIAAIAQLGGFDPQSDQVQTLSFACLVKGGVAEVFKSAGIKIGEGLAIQAIKKIPGYVIANINKKIGFSLVTRFGYSRFGKQAVVNFSKMVPVVGGVIGGGFDAAVTSGVAARAITLFIDQKIPDSPEDLEELEAEILEVEELEVVEDDLETPEAD